MRHNWISALVVFGLMVGTGPFKRALAEVQSAPQQPAQVQQSDDIDQEIDMDSQQIDADNLEIDMSNMVVADDGMMDMDFEGVDSADMEINMDSQEMDADNLDIEAANQEIDADSLVIDSGMCDQDDPDEDTDDGLLAI